MMGIALGVATVAVGVGVITQFTGDNGAGGISGSALGQYGGTLASTAANSGAYSREDLEASMIAAEAARQQGDSVYSVKGAASADDFSYGKNAQQQPAANASSGTGAYAVNDGIEGLKGGTISGMGGGGIAVADGSNAMDPAAQAAQSDARQKTGAAQPSASDSSPASSGGTDGGTASGQSGQLRTSQMAGSSGSGGAGGSGGSAALPGAGAERGAGTRAIRQAPAGSLPGQQGDITAFKGGRAGSMGGSNVRGGGDGLGAGQQGAGVGVGNSVYTSLNRTNVGTRTVVGDAAKGAADAASAFDGSALTEGIPVGDGNIRQSAVEGLSNSDADAGAAANQVKGKVGDIDHNVDLAKDLRKSLFIHLGIMAGIALGLITTIAICGQKGWPVMIAAIAASGALCIELGVYMAAKIAPLLAEMKKLPYDLNADHGKMSTFSWLVFGVLLAAGGLAWTGRINKEIGKGMKFLLGLLSTVGSGFLVGGVQKSLTGLGAGHMKIPVNPNNGGRAYNNLPEDDPNYEIMQQGVDDYNAEHFPNG
jgi:hypothetical protein